MHYVFLGSSKEDPLKPEPKTPEQYLAQAAEQELSALSIKFHDPHGHRGLMRLAQSNLDRAVELEANPLVFYNNVEGNEAGV